MKTKVYAVFFWPGGSSEPRFINCLSDYKERGHNEPEALTEEEAREVVVSCFNWDFSIGNITRENCEGLGERNGGWGYRVDDHYTWGVFMQGFEMDEDD